MKKLSSAQRELLSFSQDLVGKELEQAFAPDQCPASNLVDP
jgi:hypothetical protein